MSSSAVKAGQRQAGGRWFLMDIVCFVSSKTTDKFFDTALHSQISLNWLITQIGSRKRKTELELNISENERVV